MDYNLVSNIEICHLYKEAVPMFLIYFSHIPVAIVSMLIGFYVLSKNRQLLGRILFSITTVFSLWLFFRPFDLGIRIQQPADHVFVVFIGYLVCAILYFKLIFLLCFRG